MKINIISAYLSHTNEVVAIAPNDYFVLKAELSQDKAQEIVNKVNSVRVIEDSHWKKIKQNG